MEAELKREIIMENYLHPINKTEVNDDRYIKVISNNESCIDNIDLYILIEDNIIKDIKFQGEACAISTSATSIMIKTLLNKSIDEVEKIALNYDNMINERDYDALVLESAIVYDDIYKQQNRKTCATLPWVGLAKAILEYKNKL